MTFFHLQKQSSKSASEGGQVIMIVVLIMVVVLTVGLSLASRALVNVKNDVEEANSQKAFSAAEAGIEKAIKTQSGITAALNLGNNSSISSVTYTSVAASQMLLNNGSSILQDDGADIWLSNYPNYATPTTGRLRIYWGNSNAGGGCSEAAIEVIVISGTSNAPTLSRFAFDQCLGRRGGNSFTAPLPSAPTPIGGQTFYYYADVNYSSALIARVIPIYSSEIMAVGNYVGATLTALPSQGNVINSTGTSGSTQRKVTFYQGYSSVPSELLYGLFVPK